MISTKKIKYILQKNKNLFWFFQYMYNLTLHPNRLMAKKSFGSLNKDKTILIIRPSTDDGVQGLMSLFIQAMRWIEYANQKCYIPFVDFKNYKTQYYNEKDNVWDYYFAQPSDLRLDDVYKSRNIVLSGVSLKRSIDIDTFRGEVFNNTDLCKRCYDLIWNNIDLSKEVYSIVEKENGHGCLNLFMNVLWFFIGGVWIWLTHILFGVLLYISIIGIPFGKQHFKMAKIALSPFGKEIYS